LLGGGLADAEREVKVRGIFGREAPMAGVASLVDGEVDSSLEVMDGDGVVVVVVGDHQRFQFQACDM
jgi:hypothetical protein